MALNWGPQKTFFFQFPQKKTNFFFSIILARTWKGEKNQFKKEGDPSFFFRSKKTPKKVIFFPMEKKKPNFFF